MDFSKIKSNLKIEQMSFADLLLPENFESIKYQAYNLIDYLDWDEALNFANTLGKKLSEFQPNNNEERKIHGILSYWVMRVMLFVFINLRSAEKKELLKNHLLYILQMGLDPKRALINYLDFFSDYDIIKDEVKTLLADIGNNQEILGDQNKFAAVNFKPTVSNWLKEYQEVLSTLGEKNEPGAFHIVKFMDSNKYIKFLTNSEKAMLADLLDLHNWLLSPFVYVNKQTPNSYSSQYIKQEKYEIPEGVLLPAKKLQPPFVPVPRNVPTLVRDADIIKAAGSEQYKEARPLEKNIIEEKVEKPPVKLTQSPSMDGFKMPVSPVKSPADELGSQPFNRVNIQDLLKNREQAKGNKQDDEHRAGLHMGGGLGGNPSSIIHNPLPKEQTGGLSKEQKQAEIDRKLEELKKKREEN